MPTAGEARLKAKLTRDGASFKGKTTAVKSSTSKIGEVKRRAVSCHISGKSSIPVPVKKGAQGKENTDPNVHIDPPTKANKKLSKVKQAPDFRKLHRKWQDQLSKGKAVSKKKNTTVEPFKLAKNNQQSHKFKYNSEDEEDTVPGDDQFEIDSTALKGILNNTGIKDEDLRITGRATIAAIPSSKLQQDTQSSAGILKRTSIYYTGPPPQNAAGTSCSVSKLCSTPSTNHTAVSPLKPRNVDIAPAARSQVVSSAKKQVAWADEENDAFDFRPDSQALQSILTNTGISYNQTSVQDSGRVTLADGRLTPYRKTRQSFREEPNKRTSIYYTGPRRTRPSPRACGMGRSSVLGTRQLTAGSAINSQKTNGYDPLATVIGKQGNRELETEPMVSLGARQLTTGQPGSSFQTASNNPLLTPVRELVSGAQPSSARDQPSWAEIFTPQRGARIQETAAQAARSQPSFEPIRTPARQQALQEDICTQQGVASVQKIEMAQRSVCSTFASSSSTSARQPFIGLKQPDDILTPQHSFNNQTSNTRQQFTVDFQRHHDTMATPARQSQTGSHFSRSDLPPECSHVQEASFQLPVRTFTTPVRKGELVSQSFGLDQPPIGSEIFTPQPGKRQRPTSHAAASCSFNDPSVTPMRQSFSVFQGSGCTHQHPVVVEFTPQHPQQGGDAIHDLRPRLHCSTVQITSFQPSADTTHSSCSMEEFLTPQQIGGVRKKHFKLTTVEEEDDIARLERQALEDLRLLKISEEPSASSTKIQANSDLVRSPTFDARTDQSRTATSEQPSLRSVSTYRSAKGALDPHISSCNVTSKSHSQHSSFENSASFTSAFRFASPTPVQENGIISYNSLQSSSSTQRGRELATSRDVSSIPFNSTPLFNHQELSENNALRVNETSTCTYRGLRPDSQKYSQINQTPCIAPTPVKVSRHPALRTTFREPRVTSVSCKSSVPIPKKTLAQEALLDIEVSVFMTAGPGRVVTGRDWNHRPMNPLAKVFVEGDSTHFLPINVHQSLKHPAAV